MTTGGIDEVGYGSWAGPIISVVAAFDEQTASRLPSGITDSKKTTEKTRSACYLPLCRACLDVGIGHAWPWEIDALGAHVALQLSYERAIDELVHPPQRLYVDGKFPVRVWQGEQICEPKADLKYLEVSAASMIAKHFRDTMMADYAKLHPGYGWERNRGYGTYDHEQAIRKLGLLVDANDKKRYLHRQSYCRKVMVRGG